MKIAYITDVMYPYVKGGSEKRTWEMSKRLAKKHEVHIFSMKYWDGDKNCIRENVHLHGVCKPLRLYKESGKRSVLQAIYFTIMLLPELRKHEFDIVDCNQFPILPIFPTKIYSLLKKTPMVVTWHEVWNRYWFYYLGILGVFGIFVEKLATWLPHQIIAVSEKTKKDLLSFGTKRRKLTVISNGIDFTEINGTKPTGIGFDVLFSGRLIADKNVDVLIRAITLIEPKVKCGIIGDGPEKDRLTELAKELEVGDRVIFLGFQKYKNLIAEMRSSRVYVLPSTREGFGICIIEANASGLPVIAVRHKGSAATDLIDDGVNGYLVELSEKEIADKISFLLKNEGKRAELGRNGIERAKGFDWDMMVQKLEKFYSALLL